MTFTVWKGVCSVHIPTIPTITQVLTLNWNLGEKNKRPFLIIFIYSDQI